MGTNCFSSLSCRLSQEQIQLIIRCYIADIEATKIAFITKINRNTINKYVTLFRETVAKQAKESIKTISDESFYICSIQKGIVVIETMGQEALERVKETCKEYAIVNPTTHAYRLIRQQGASSVETLESFWLYTVQRIKKLRGLQPGKRLMHMLESAWRFNNRKKNLYDTFVDMLQRK